MEAVQHALNSTLRTVDRGHHFGEEGCSLDARRICWKCTRYSSEAPLALVAQLSSVFAEDADDAALDLHIAGRDHDWGHF